MLKDLEMQEKFAKRYETLDREFHASNPVLEDTPTGDYSPDVMKYLDDRAALDAEYDAAVEAERYLGSRLAVISEHRGWPKSSTLNNGEHRGDIHVALDCGIPQIEVTVADDWTTGGDWGSDPGERRVIFVAALPYSERFYLGKLLEESQNLDKLKMLVEDIDKYSPRLYGFQLVEGGASA